MRLPFSLPFGLPFRERDPRPIGAIGLLVLALFVVLASFLAVGLALAAAGLSALPRAVARRLGASA